MDALITRNGHDDPVSFMFLNHLLHVKKEIVKVDNHYL